MKIWKELKHRLEKGVETASQKSQQMVEISRLNMRIRGKKEDINRLYRRLGILAFEAWNKNRGGRLVLSREMKKVLQSIHQVQADITVMEQDLLLVRGKVDCSACGAVLDRGTKKCPVCQTPISTVMDSSPDEHFTAAEPQATNHFSHRHQSKSSASRTASFSKHRQMAKGEYWKSDVPDSRRALAEFQTATGEAIFICPMCGNQLKKLVNTCPFCGEKFL